MVSGSSDNSIRIWDIEHGTCLRTLEGHEELVRCIRFDNKRIVSGAYDGKYKPSTSVVPAKHFDKSIFRKNKNLGFKSGSRS